VVIGKPRVGRRVDHPLGATVSHLSSGFSLFEANDLKCILSTTVAWVDDFQVRGGYCRIAIYVLFAVAASLEGAFVTHRSHLRLSHYRQAHLQNRFFDLENAQNSLRKPCLFLQAVYPHISDKVHCLLKRIYPFVSPENLLLFTNKLLR
jgi:hypothetical protein